MPSLHLEKTSLRTLEIWIGHDFSDRKLLETALTHASMGGKNNYERLEFLGDRVLGLVIAELLFKRFAHEKEGDMAKRLAALVQGSLLAGIAREMDLGRYIQLSGADMRANGAENDNILADVFEAILGALYLDGGFEKCQSLIHKLWASRLDIMIEPPQHPKTVLQEWAQGAGLSLPVYSVVGQSGPDHAPVFEVELVIEGHTPLRAQGRSRQVAEKEVARLFLERLETEKIKKDQP